MKVQGILLIFVLSVTYLAADTQNQTLSNYSGSQINKKKTLKKKLHHRILTADLIQRGDSSDANQYDNVPANMSMSAFGGPNFPGFNYGNQYDENTRISQNLNVEDKPKKRHNRNRNLFFPHMFHPYSPMMGMYNPYMWAMNPMMMGMHHPMAYNMMMYPYMMAMNPMMSMMAMNPFMMWNPAMMMSMGGMFGGYNQPIGGGQNQNQNEGGEQQAADQQEKQEGKRLKRRLGKNRINTTLDAEELNNEFENQFNFDPTVFAHQMEELEKESAEQIPMNYFEEQNEGKL